MQKNLPLVLKCTLSVRNFYIKGSFYIKGCDKAYKKVAPLLE